MMKRNLGIAALALAGSAMFAESALAKNIAVGPLTCRVTITGVNRHTTIQAAVNAAVANDVIYVCPGNYPEQVVIDKAITLRGESDGLGNLVVITVPADGLKANAMSAGYANDPYSTGGGAVAVQLLVQNTAFPKVLNLAVDGTLPPGVCPAAAAHRSVGIAFINVGVPADGGPSSGSIANVVVRKHADDCLGPGKPAVKGVGILAEHANITINDSNVHTIRGDGIRQHGGYVDINRNFLMAVWDYSVKITAALKSDVRFNTIIHSNHGVVVQSPATNVTSNIIGPYIGVGIFLAGGVERALVTSNKMNNTTTGIWVNESFGSVVQSNIIYQTGTGIIDTYSRSVAGNLDRPQNIIKSNEVNEAKIGMQTTAASDDVLTPNTYTNVATLSAPY